MCDDAVVQRMQQVYDADALRYVRSTGRYANFPGLQAEADRFLAKIGQNGPILDAGCGVGRDTAYFALLGYTVIALDLSSEMLRLTRERSLRTSRCRVVPVQADMRFLPLCSDSVWESGRAQVYYTCQGHQ